MMIRDCRSDAEAGESTRFLELRARVQSKALDLGLLLRVEVDGCAWRFQAGGELMRWAVNAAAKTLSANHENPKAFLKAALSNRPPHQAFAYLNHFIGEESYERIENWLDGKIAERDAERAAARELAALRESERLGESSRFDGAGEEKPVASAVD